MKLKVKQGHFMFRPLSEKFLNPGYYTPYYRRLGFKIKVSFYLLFRVDM